MHQRYDTLLKEVNISKTGVKKYFLNYCSYHIWKGPNHSKMFFNTCMIHFICEKDLTLLQSFPSLLYLISLSMDGKKVAEKRPLPYLTLPVGIWRLLVCSWTARNSFVCVWEFCLSVLMADTRLYPGPNYSI